jgi:hypothetical protein
MELLTTVFSPQILPFAELLCTTTDLAWLMGLELNTPGTAISAFATSVAVDDGVNQPCTGMPKNCSLNFPLHV